MEVVKLFYGVISQEDLEFSLDDVGVEIEDDDDVVY